MYPTASHLVDLQKNHLATLHVVTRTLIEAVQELANLNLATTRTAVQEVNQTLAGWLEGQGAPDQLAALGGLAQPAAEGSLRYSRNVYGITCRTGAELSKIIEARVAEGTDAISRLIETTAKNGPPGCEAAASFWVGAINASKPVFDTISQTVVRTAELAGANLIDGAAADKVVGQAGAPAPEAI